jgi:O-methyltransferase
MVLKKTLSNWLWRSQTDRMLDRKGFANCTLHHDADFLALFREIHAAGTALLGLREMNNIYKLVQTAAPISGDIAEVGVYKGGSARIICQVKGPKHLHLFDTFEGMPEVNTSVDRHKKGDFADTSEEGVRRYLAAFDNVSFHKGFFPQSAAGLHADTAFSFVNLDVDIYDSTLAGLKFFYPRLNQGGLILCHDYRSISCPGVKKAYDEFFADKAEHVVELWDTQCLVIKA